MTQTQLILVQAEAAMLQVMDWLQWDDVTYTGFKFRQGLRYLKAVVPDEHDQEAMMRTQEYWGWWKMQWYLRDQQWLVDCENARNLSGMRLSPVGLEEVDRLSDDFTPNPLRTLSGRNTSYQNLHNGANLAKNPQLEESYGRDLITILNRRRVHG